MSAFDVWVVRFEPSEMSPAERLQEAFGIDAPSAATLAENLPRIVKHGVTAKSAGEMRQALEAIGAVVECRPARAAKPTAAEDSQAVFRAPDADLLSTGRVSAIDPFSPSSDASRPRISIDGSIPPLSRQTMPAEAEPEARRTIGASLLATSRVKQRRKFLRQELGAVLAGVAIISIGVLFGNSIFRGEADWIGIGFDAIGIYFIGVGVFDSVRTWRS